MLDVAIESNIGSRTEPQIRFLSNQPLVSCLLAFHVSSIFFRCSFRSFAAHPFPSNLRLHPRKFLSVHAATFLSSTALYSFPFLPLQPFFYFYLVLSCTVFFQLPLAVSRFNHSYSSPTMFSFPFPSSLSFLLLFSFPFHRPQFIFLRSTL